MKTVIIFLCSFFFISGLFAQVNHTEFEKIIMPSRNFNVLGHIKIKDPKDGKEKNCASHLRSCKIRYVSHI